MGCIICVAYIMEFLGLHSRNTIVGYNTHTPQKNRTTITCTTGKYQEESWVEWYSLIIYNYMSADQVLYTKSNTMTIRDLAE